MKVGLLKRSTKLTNRANKKRRLIAKIINERRDTTTDVTKIKRIKRDFYEPIICQQII